MSYYRNCRTCGRRIQIRQMPGGQWVAFEGYNTLHDCSTAPVSAKMDPTPREGRQQRPDGELTNYDGLDFVDVQLPGASPPREQPRSPFQRPGRPVTEEDSLEQRLRTAAAERRVVRITFISRTGTTTIRDIEPLTLEGGSCVAYCRLRHSPRTFNLRSIQSASYTGDTFFPRANSAVPRSSFTRATVASLRKPQRRIPGWAWALGVVLLIVLVRACHT